MQSIVLILPGLGNSGPLHWQTLWQNAHSDFIRVEQANWETPEKEEWIDTIDQELIKHPLSQVVLVGHSLACTTIAYWAKKYNRKIKGALMVAPSDTETELYKTFQTTGFTPVPLEPLPFKSIVVASEDDIYVSLERATLFAKAWGSEFINIGKAGHINSASGLGEWKQGLKLLNSIKI